ncbi:response regulator [Pseudalkalibacillus salsuginis]|uniref:response regulator n=1 Tax=Pseudalkalibacillus salsuginis TaxID=2910972 RepID=UPI001F1F101C|nr:response regulator [Pseudalkalibacillus salsuginis]MCF6409759.1 response regulator [Pseudalkalibacillus salsuginis]
MDKIRESNQSGGMLLDERQAVRFFDVLKANVERSKTSMTAIFLTVHSQTIFRKEDEDFIDQGITSYLVSKIRQTDVVVKLSKPYQWAVILSQSKEEEAKAFLERIFNDVKDSDDRLFLIYDLIFSSGVAEIGNGDVQFEDLLDKGQQALANSSRTGDWVIEYVIDYKEKNMEEVKVSIIEEDEILTNILTATLHNISSDQFQLLIRMFQEGEDFLQSDWSSTSHTHLIIMNDILPRKNGLEVLHMIRKLPNNKRFIIYMMTKRNSEEDIIYAYESGVDHYIIKPFNIRLLEAQLKRTLERLWV